MHARHTVYTISPSPDATLAIEIKQTGLTKQKRLFVFERFTGELIYDLHDPLSSSLNLDIEAASLVCRDTGASAGKRERSTKLARTTAVEAARYPQLQINLRRFIAKPLRGFVSQGTVLFRGSELAIKCNVGFGVEKNGRLQIDADAVVPLSEFAIACPPSSFGLVRTENDAVLHALLWGIAEKRAQSSL